MTAREKVILAIVLGVVALLIWGAASTIVDVERQFDARNRRALAWQKFATAHCRVVAVSAGGATSVSIVAYRCDETRDYLSYDGRAPEGWTPEGGK